MSKEDDIKKLAGAGKIEFADTAEIDDYADIAREFLDKIFGVDYDASFISDESTLSDFSGCCAPDNYDEELPYEVINDLCKLNMVKVIGDEYGITVDPYDYLITTLEKIKQQRNHQLQ